MQRRNFLKITAGLGVAAFAAACSKQETAPSEQAATSAASSSAAEQHQRVIALNTGQLDNLLMLRILPVGAAKAKNLGVVPDYIRNRFGSDFDLDSIADCGLRANPDLETIASLKPTLICANLRTDEAILEQLKAIAPVVTGEGGGENWKQDLLTIAEAVGKKESAETLLAEYESNAKAWGEGLSSKPTVSFLRSKDDQFQLYGVNSMAGSVAADAGLPRPANQKQIKKAGQDISAEQLSEADADWIFYGVNAGAADPSQAATWQSLKAVQANQAVSVDYESWYMNASLLSATIILQGLKDNIK